MALKVVTLHDKERIEHFLGQEPHELCAYSFATLYIWKALFEISWDIIDESLCLFFSDATGCFMCCPPLPSGCRAEAVRQAFCLMDSRNKNKAVSRIENIEQRDVDWYRAQGYAVTEKFPEYLYDRRELSCLRGNKYKSKRASVNYFSAHYTYRFEEYRDTYRQECLALYLSWAHSRKNGDSVYQGMLKDSFSALQVLLEGWQGLGVVGRVVMVNGQLKAFTFGCRVNATTVGVLYEVADTSVKGLGQYIFKAFCDEFNEVVFINAMDDSGLANLKRVKLSYHPVRLVRSYMAGRRNNE